MHLRLLLKKIFAISLLLIHLFNIAGYHFLFNYFIHQSDIKASLKFDQNLYQDKDLEEVKIPLNLPYMGEMSAFERIDGIVEFNGIHYNYVKRKVSKDTLYILCKTNYAKTTLVNARTNYAGAVNDAPLNKKFPASSVKKDINPGEYNQPHHEYCINNPFATTSIFASLKSSKLPAGFYPAQGEPPGQGC